MDVIKCRELYITNTLDRVTLLEAVRMLDKMLEFLDIEYYWETYDLHYDACFIVLNVYNFIKVFEEYKVKQKDIQKELIELYVIAIMHKDYGERYLQLEF